MHKQEAKQQIEEKYVAPTDILTNEYQKRMIFSVSKFVTDQRECFWNTSKVVHMMLLLVLRVCFFLQKLMRCLYVHVLQTNFLGRNKETSQFLLETCAGRKVWDTKFSWHWNRNKFRNQKNPFITNVIASKFLKRKYVYQVRLQGFSQRL